jgi:hypothetical protein
MVLPYMYIVKLSHISGITDTHKKGSPDQKKNPDATKFSTY